MRSLIALLATLLLALHPAPTSAQGPARIRFIVRDATATPQPGITVVLDSGDGSGAQPRVTDDTGATAYIPTPTGLVTVTQVLDSDGTPLTFEMTTLDGLLVIPLAPGDLDVPWAYDRQSRSVVSLPRTMANEAFPELEVLPAEADSQVELAASPEPTGVAGAVVIGGDEAPEEGGGGGIFWLIVGGLLLAGLGLGLFVWVQARRQDLATARRRRGRR